MKNQIREVRKAAKITQEELAKIIGITHATLSRYESGAIDPPTSKLQSIASALGVSILDLFDISPEQRKELEAEAQEGREADALIERVHGALKTAEAGTREAFKGVKPGDLASIISDIVSDELTQDGQILALKYVIDLRDNPKYCRQCSSEYWASLEAGGG